MGNPSKWEWSTNKETAAQLLAEDSLSIPQIAQQLGTSESTVDRWKKVPEISGTPSMAEVVRDRRDRCERRERRDLSGLNLEDLIRKGAQDDERVKRERQYDLDDAARTLTKQVAGRWGQNPYRVEFRADG